MYHDSTFNITPHLPQFFFVFALDRNIIRSHSFRDMSLHAFEAFNFVL